VAVGITAGAGVSTGGIVVTDEPGVVDWLIGIDCDWVGVEESEGGEVGDGVGGLILVMPAEQLTRSETVIAMKKNACNF